MKELSHKYALAALRERRAEIAGEITQLESRLRSLRASIEHVDGALVLFDPDTDPSQIKPKKPYRRVKLFGQGKLNRMILDMLRKADRPMKTLEVAQAIAADMDFSEAAAAGLKNRVRANLLYLWKVRGAIMKNGERETAAWSVNQAAVSYSK